MTSTLGADLTRSEARVAPGSRVCIVLLSGIGDVVHGLPVATALKQDNPSRKIIWVAEPAPAQLLISHPAVDRVIVFHRKNGVRGVYDLWRSFRAEPAFDQVLNMQRYAKSIFPVYFSGASERLGLSPSLTRDGVRFVNNRFTAPGGWRHTQDLFLEFLDAVGVTRPDPLDWGITLSEAEEQAASCFFSESEGAPIAGLVLATGNPRKDWPIDRYLALARALEREFGYEVLLLGGPGEREGAAARAILEEVGPVSRRSALSKSVRQLIWSIRACDLVISPDTGALHIAHAMGVPVIGLFGHTNPWRVGPYRHFRDLIVDRYTDPGEPPDASNYAARSGRMEQIGVTDVLDRVRWARAQYGAGHGG